MLVAGGSCLVSGPAGAACSFDVLCCLDALPSAMSSATSRFDVGIGNGVLTICLWWLAVVLCALLCVCAGFDWRAWYCVGIVCAPVVVWGLATIFAAGSVMKFDAVRVVIGALLMTSKSCLLYLSGLICLLVALDLTTLLEMPKMFSLVEVSLPSQIAGKNLASIFGICFAVGNM